MELADFPEMYGLLFYETLLAFLKPRRASVTLVLQGDVSMKTLQVTEDKEDKPQMLNDWLTHSFTGLVPNLLFRKN